MLQWEWSAYFMEPGPTVLHWRIYVTPLKLHKVGPGSRWYITLPSQTPRKEACLWTLFFSCLFLLEVGRLTPEHILRIISRQNVLGVPHLSPGTLSCFLKFSSNPCARRGGATLTKAPMWVLEPSLAGPLSSSWLGHRLYLAVVLML